MVDGAFGSRDEVDGRCGIGIIFFVEFGAFGLEDVKRDDLLFGRNPCRRDVKGLPTPFNTVNVD